MVDNLIQDFVFLLDVGLEEAAAQLTVVQAAPALPQTLDPLGVPQWVTQGAVNFRSKVHMTGNQYVALFSWAMLQGQWRMP